MTGSLSWSETNALTSGASFAGKESMAAAHVSASPSVKGGKSRRRKGSKSSRRKSKKCKKSRKSRRKRY